MDRKRLIKLLKAMEKNDREVSKITNSNELLTEARTIESVIWLLKDNDYAEKTWKIYFKEEN